MKFPNASFALFDPSTKSLNKPAIELVNPEVMLCASVTPCWNALSESFTSLLIVSAKPARNASPDCTEVTVNCSMPARSVWMRPLMPAKSSSLNKLLAINPSYSWISAASGLIWFWRSAKNAEPRVRLSFSSCADRALSSCA